MADKYDFSAFDNAVKKEPSASEQKYDLSAFDQAAKPEEQPSILSQMMSDAGESAANLGKGITQGVTLGSAPYIAGGINTGIDYITGDYTPESFDKNVAASKKVLEPTSQDSILQKLLYKGGELGGGVIPFEATAAMGLGANSIRGSKIAQSLGAGEQIALKEAAQKGIGGLAKEVGTRFTAGVPQGAVLGGGAAALSGGSAGDIASGAASGGLISGAIGTLGLGGKKSETPAAATEEGISSGPVASQVSEGWRQGYEEGNNLLSSKGKTALRTEGLEQSKDLMQKISSVDEELSNNVGSAIKTATKQGYTIPIGQDLDALSGQLQNLFESNSLVADNPTAQKALGKLFRTKEDLTPQEAASLKEQLTSLSDAFYNDPKAGSKAYGKMLGDLKKSLVQKMNTVIDGYQDASTKLAGYRSSLVGQIKSGGIPEDLSMPSGSLSNPLKQGDFLGDLRGLISQIRKQGNNPGKDTMIALGQKLEELNQSQPEIFTKLGFENKQDFINNFNKMGDKAAVLQSLEGASTSGANGLGKTPWGSGIFGKVTDLGANVAGNIARKTVKPAADIGKAAYNYSSEQLGQVGQRLANSHIPGTEHLAEALNNAITKNDSMRKNQILFSILQQPSMRHLVDLNPEQEAVK